MSFMMDSLAGLSNTIFNQAEEVSTVDNDLKALLISVSLEDYEKRLIENNITTIKQLRLLSFKELEKLIPEKPVHARRLADSLSSVPPISTHFDVDVEVGSPERRISGSPNKSPRISLKERRKGDKSPNPRGNRSQSEPKSPSFNRGRSSSNSEKTVSIQPSPGGKRSTMLSNNRDKLSKKSPPPRKQGSADLDSLSSSIDSNSNNSNSNKTQEYVETSKKATANFRFQRAIRRVMLANATIRIWREGLGRELMEIVREKNSLAVDNEEFKLASHAKKTYMKLFTVRNAIDRLVKSYKKRGLQPQFPATQVALFLSHFPGDVSHGERLFVALALLDCMDSQEAGDVSDTVGTRGTYVSSFRV